MDLSSFIEGYNSPHLAQRRTLGNVRDGHQWSARRRSPLQPGPFLHTSLYGLLHHRRRRDSHDVPLLGGVQVKRCQPRYFRYIAGSEKHWEVKRNLIISRGKYGIQPEYTGNDG